jgi:hypothetical protein
VQKAVIVVFIGIFLFGCRTTGGVVLDQGIGASEFRENMENLRSGETELAVTGTKLEAESRELRSGISELERSIAESAGTESEIDAILRRIRGRPIPDHVAEEYAINSTGSGE